MNRETIPQYSYRKKKEWKKALLQSFHQLPPWSIDARLQAAILSAKREASQKQRRQRISFARFLGKQLPGIGWKLWSLQGLFFLSVNAFLSDAAEYLRSPLRLAKLLFCLSVAVFMTALPLLYRSIHYRMQEVEAATRFSSVKLLLAKLIIVGIGDLILLCGIFFAAMAKTSLSADTTVICLCFPFLLAGGGCLYMLGHLSPNRFLAGSLLFCTALLLVFSFLPEACAFLFQPAFAAAQIVSCALLLTFCAKQIHYLISLSSYEELQLN